MFINEMNLKAHYEMKREETEKAILASKYSKKSQNTKLYRNFINLFKKNIKQNVQKSICCEIKIQKACCGN